MPGPAGDDEPRRFPAQHPGWDREMAARPKLPHPPRGPAAGSPSKETLDRQLQRDLEDGRNRRQALAAALDLVQVREDGKYFNTAFEPVSRGELVLDVAQELEGWLRTGERS